MKKYLLLLFAAALFGMIGCDKSTTDSSDPKKPVVPKASVTGPQTQSSDQHAQQANAFAEMVNGFANFASAYSSLPGTQNGNTWTYSYGQGGYSMTMTAVVATDGSVTWKMVFNGQEPGDSVVYNNWTAMEGTVSGDGKSGSWKIYHDNSTVIAAQFDFATAANGTVTSELVVNNENGTLEGSYRFINNADGSGEAYYYNGTVLAMKFVWAANGAGSWWTYDTNGTETGTGIWS
ncbi:MAG: hypothetical protein WCT99_01310 [Bacteroidota bacterium]